jgi:hypothetical protein
MNYFPDKLLLEDAGMSGGSRVFSLRRRFRYVSSFGIIEVPAGTTTDGASIPRAFWAIFDPFGEYFGAAVIHDFLYSKANDEYDRSEADYIFDEAMYNIGIPWYKRHVLWATVRLFGKSSFKGIIK